jgi:hypothetical protein
MTDFDDTFGEAPSREAFENQSFGIYPRVSSLAQSREDKSSLDAQIDACREYGESLGMRLDGECVRREAHTATTLDHARPPRTEGAPRRHARASGQKSRH